MDAIITGIVLIIGVFGVMKIISSIRSNDSPQKGVSSVQSHDINSGYLIGKQQELQFNQQQKAIEAKKNARDALVGLQVNDHAIEIAKNQRDVLLKQSEFEKKMTALRLEWQHAEHQAVHEVNVAVLNEAKNRKLDTASYQAIALSEANANVEVQRERGLSEVRINEHEKIKRIDTDAALIEQLNTIRAIVEYKNLGFNGMDEIKHRIFGLIEEEDLIERSNVSAQVKGQKLTLIEEQKRFYMEVLNALKNRLLEAGDEEQISGIEAVSSISRGLGAYSEASTEDETSAFALRDRREQSGH